MIVLNLVVYGDAADPRARTAGSRCRCFSFQSSEFGKMLLIVALAAFAVDRSRRLHERRTTARIMLLALIPALIVIPQPDLGTGLVYVVDRVRDPVLRRAPRGSSWPALVALFVVVDRDRAGRRAGAGRPRAQALPGAAV